MEFDYKGTKITAFTDADGSIKIEAEGVWRVLSESNGFWKELGTEDCGDNLSVSDLYITIMNYGNKDFLRWCVDKMLPAVCAFHTWKDLPRENDEEKKLWAATLHKVINRIAKGTDEPISFKLTAMDRR
ncbi:MAG: hypothetical protein V1844_17170 [Pseudomonadota bacterium]